MDMQGFNISEAGHPIPILLPQNITGGANALIFRMSGAAHVSSLISVGALAAQLGAITINACTNEAGSNPTAIGFRYYAQTTAGAGNDQLGAPTVATSAGFTPPNTPNVLYVIELDASELDSLGDSDGADFPYLQVAFANGANADFVSAVAVLSGLRYQYQKNPTQTV
jgi:hypothetical protein